MFERKQNKIMTSIKESFIIALKKRIHLLVLFISNTLYLDLNF